MEVNQIYTLEQLVETISNLIDLYKGNANQNSFKPKNLGVESKYIAPVATTVLANSQRCITTKPSLSMLLDLHHAFLTNLPSPRRRSAANILRLPLRLTAYLPEDHMIRSQSSAKNNHQPKKRRLCLSFTSPRRSKEDIKGIVDRPRDMEIFFNILLFPSLVY